MKSLLNAVAMFLLFLTANVWADSVGNTNPTLAARVGVKGGACSSNYETGITSAGQALICYGGVWKTVGQSGKTVVSEYYVYTAADNNTTKVLIAYCPVGKKVVGGDCNFDGGTNQHKNVLGHSIGDRGYWCFFAFNNVYNPAVPTLGVESRADCIDE